MSSWGTTVRLMRGAWIAAGPAAPFRRMCREDRGKAAQFVNLTGGWVPPAGGHKPKSHTTGDDTPFGSKSLDSDGIKHKSPTNSSRKTEELFLNCRCVEGETSGPVSLLQNAV